MIFSVIAEKAIPQLLKEPLGHFRKYFNISPKLLQYLFGKNFRQPKKNFLRQVIRDKKNRFWNYCFYMFQALLRFVF